MLLFHLKFVLDFEIMFLVEFFFCCKFHLIFFEFKLILLNYPNNIIIFLDVEVFSLKFDSSTRELKTLKLRVLILSHIISLMVQNCVHNNSYVNHSIETLYKRVK